MLIPNSLKDPLIERPGRRYASRCAMGNYFLGSRKKQFLFLSISKNACSSLRWMLYKLECGVEPEDSHVAFGFQERDDELVMIDRRNRAALDRYAGYLKFAVYRDPVERLLSTYHNKVLWPPTPHPYYTRKRLEGLPLDAFLDVVAEALQIADPLDIDEHMRPQRRCYEPEDVDFIVPIESLPAFLLDKFGIDSLPHTNTHEGIRIQPTPCQLERIRELYREDYQIVSNYPG